MKGVCSYCQSVHPARRTWNGNIMADHNDASGKECEGVDKTPEVIIHEKGDAREVIDSSIWPDSYEY